MTVKKGRPALTWEAANRATALLERSWWSWAGPHGGLLASLAVAAAEHHGDGLPVRELSAQFLAPPAEGAVELETRWLRQGGSSGVLGVTLGTGSTLALAATVLTGRSRPGRASAAVAAPAVPGPDDCPPVELPVDLVPFLQHLDFRPANDTALLGGAAQAEFVGWLRLRDGSVSDAQALTLLVDALPPALYAVLTSPVPVPSVALSVQYTDPTSAPISGWVLGRITTRSAGGGWCVDDSDLWSPDGQLLASARQTRRVLEVTTPNDPALLIEAEADTVVP
jgi:acyl-CoA thioesterase